eukprot:TRINITY_DN65830_c0_g1_i1.p1 TRINITY_DN65830_c0_g1~~TRINITY_DN65830_c0_g1_i1.p1  ORF type:complete len:566 (+),score=286.92 TRINITY_DN65830_c0_g1_i1:153-1700(+)
MAASESQQTLKERKPVTYEASLWLLCSSIVWCGMHWGFTSFGAKALHEDPDLQLSFTQIGSFIPAFAIVYTGGVYVVGLIGDRYPAKGQIVMAQCFIIGGQALFVFVKMFATQVVAFGLIGVGYSVYAIIPYVQIKIFSGNNSKLYDKWYLIVMLSFVTSFGGARLLMMLSTTYIDRSSYFRWRLPWLLAGAMQSLHMVLIVMFARFQNPDGPLDKEKLKGALQPAPDSKEYTYLDKIRRFYLAPVSLLTAMGYLFMSYAHGSVAIWAPTFAFKRFTTITEEELNWTISLCVLSAMPFGLVVTAVLMRRAKNIRSAMRICACAVVLATASMAVFSFVQVFLVFCATLILFVTFAGFPHFFIKQLPYVLGFPKEIAIFAVSRLVLIYALVGDIAGSFLTGVLLDELGEGRTISILFASTLVSTALWGTVGVWSFSDSGPIADRADEQRKEKALENWDLLSSFTFKSLRVSQSLSRFTNYGGGNWLAIVMSGRFDDDGHFVQGDKLRFSDDSDEEEQ